MSWKKLSDYLGKKNIVLEVGEGSGNYRFPQSIILFEYISKPTYPNSAYSNSAYIGNFKAFPSNGYNMNITTDFAVREVSEEEEQKIRNQFERKALDNLRYGLGHGFMIGSEVETFIKGKKKVLKPKYQGCLESHFYRLQELMPVNKDLSIKKKDGKLGQSVIKFSSGFKGKERKQAIEALDGILAVACVALFSNYKDILPKAPKVKSPVFSTALTYNRISNVWVMHPLSGNLVMDLARKVAVFGKKGLFKFWEATPQEIEKCITTNDVALARKILTRNKDLFIKLLHAAYSDDSEIAVETVYELFMTGIHKNIKNSFKLSNNWLKGTDTSYNNNIGEDEEDDGEIANYQIGINISKLRTGTKF